MSDNAPTAVVIPTARPTFAVEAAAERAAAARALLQELGAEVVGPHELVMTAEGVDAAAAYIEPDADLIVNVCASFSDASPALRLYGGLERPVLLWAFREPGPVGDRLWLNSLCGANLFGHALVRAGGAARLLHGDPEEPEVRRTLGRALAGELPPAVTLPSHDRANDDSQAAAVAQEGLEALRGRRIGLVGDAPAGFTPCEYDGDLIERLFGVGIQDVATEQVISNAAAVGDAERAAERAAAREQRPSMRDLDADQVDRAAAVTTALQDWTRQAELAAVAVRCWPEFPTEFGVCPCSALSRLADAGTPTACERDVYGALTMLLLEALGAGTTYLVDTVDIDAERGVVRMWHCGSAATALAADPAEATQDVHCNRRIGVAGNFPLRPGPVVVSRIADDPDASNPTGLRLLLTAGESLPEPNRFQGNTAAVRVEGSATELVHGLVTGGFPHHTVLAWTDVRPQLRAAAHILDIPVIEW